MRRFKEEKNGEVRKQIGYFLGAAKAKPAVDMLIRELGDDPSNVDVVYALGAIGDVKAVPAIIKAANAAQINHHCYLAGLGRLPTPEAVDYLIANLDKGGVEALFASHSPRALP